MFGTHSSEGYQEIIGGIKIKTLSYGGNTLMSEFILKKDSVLPAHEHPYEQTGYLVSGKIRLFIDGKSKILNKGDSWNIPPNIGHKAEILEDSVAIEIFSPRRDDYLGFVIESDISI